MRTYYQVQAYDQDGQFVDVIDTFDNYQDALACQFRCEEGDDKHDPLDYIIEDTSVAE